MPSEQTNFRPQLFPYKGASLSCAVSQSVVHLFFDYVGFPDKFPEDLFPRYKAGTIARLKWNLYGSKSAHKLWYNCLYQFTIELGFKLVAGHPCLFICVTRMRGETIVIVIGVFIDDFLVTGNCKSAINEVKERMNKRFVLSDQEYLEYYLGVEISHLDDKTFVAS